MQLEKYHHLPFGTTTSFKSKEKKRITVDEKKLESANDLILLNLYVGHFLDDKDRSYQRMEKNNGSVHLRTRLILCQDG